MNRKRWIALLLAMVMALGLVGCGGKTPDAAPTLSRIRARTAPLPSPI